MVVDPRWVSSAVQALAALTLVGLPHPAEVSPRCGTRDTGYGPRPIYGKSKDLGHDREGESMGMDSDVRQCYDMLPSGKRVQSVHPLEIVDLCQSVSL